MAKKKRGRGRPKTEQRGRPKICLENETDRQHEAYELYFSLGDSLPVRQRVIKIEKELDIAYATIFNWRKVLKWDERCAERKKKVRRRVELRTERDMVETRARYLDIIDGIINQYLDRTELNPEDIIQINNTVDIDRILKLGLLLMGEATSRSEGKTPEEIKAEVKKRAEEYVNYFEDLEGEKDGDAEPVGEEVAQDATDQTPDDAGEENPDDGDIGE